MPFLVDVPNFDATEGNFFEVKSITVAGGLLCQTYM